MAMRLVEGLSALGFDAFLFTVDSTVDYATCGPGINQHQLPKDHLIHLSRSNVTWPTLAKVFLAPWQLLALESQARRLGIRLIISIMERANIFNLMQHSVPVRIIAVRSHPTMLMSAKAPLKRSLVAWSYRRLLPKADRIVFNSREMTSDFEKMFAVNADRSRVIYNFCDIALLDYLARAPLTAEQERIFLNPVMLACGRLDRPKGHWHLLRAFRRVCEILETIRLVIVGKGPLEDYLRALAKELGISDRVHFLGFVENPMPLIARAKVFVLPSVFEGFPNALLEAMTLGAPVISTDCRSGPRELLVPDSDPETKTNVCVRTSCGMLTPALAGQMRSGEQSLTAGELSLADAMIEMLSDEAYLAKCAIESRRRAMDFSHEGILAQWKGLIEELL
jgi:glycosyltransferase involved in cell wall biosynthesis